MKRISSEDRPGADKNPFTLHPREGNGRIASVTGAVLIAAILTATVHGTCSFLHLSTLSVVAAAAKALLYHPAIAVFLVLLVFLVLRGRNSR